MQVNAKTTNNDVKNWLLGLLVDSKTIARAKLMDECLDKFGLSQKEIKDSSSNSKKTKCKSLIGSVIAEMDSAGEIQISEDKIVTLVKTVKEINLQEKIDQYLLSLLKDGIGYTKKQLYEKCEEKFNKSDDRSENKPNIRSLTGDLISKMISSLMLEVNQKTGICKLIEKIDFPNTEIGNLLRNAEQTGNVDRYFIEILNLKGGEFFEQYSVKLVEKVLAKGSKITKSDVIGGTSDNGIDGIIENIDLLGYSERILIQAKTRTKVRTVTVKEMREFYGALYSEKGTRGIFITTSSFHKEATKFLQKCYNLIGIDSKKLIQLAKSENYGFKDNKIDMDLFLD